MIKKLGMRVLAVCLLVVLLIPGVLQAQGGIEVLDSSAEVEFPLVLHFDLSARSDADITDIRLRYIVDRESYAQVTSEAYVEFVPDTAVDVRWSWDLRRTGGLPPGAIVQYWWVVTDINGGRVETARRQIQFEDGRYSWRSLAEGKVTIYWYEGGQSFAGGVALATREALVRLEEETGAYLTKSVKIYVYANARDMQGAMIFPQEWSGGVAYTRYGIIAIGIAPHNISWGKRAIVHELTHLVIHQMTFNAYSGLPTWLDEGLAMYAEGELGAEFAAYLERAIREDSLISVRSLSSPFSAYAEESYLSYAESYSIVEFLISGQGQDKMLELLNTFKKGSGYDEALTAVYGFDMDGLDALWKGYARSQYQRGGITVTALSPGLVSTLTRLVSDLLPGRLLAGQIRSRGLDW